MDEKLLNPRVLALIRHTLAKSTLFELKVVHYDTPAEQLILWHDHSKLAFDNAKNVTLSSKGAGKNS